MYEDTQHRACERCPEHVSHDEFGIRLDANLDKCAVAHSNAANVVTRLTLQFCIDDSPEDGYVT